MLFLMPLLAMMATKLDRQLSDRPIARVGQRVIRWSEIACDPGVIDEAAAKARNTTVEEACHQLEESNLYRLVGLQLTATAAHKYKLELTVTERAEAVPAKYRDEKLIWQMTEANRIQARVALRVLRGERRERVFEEELSDRALAAKGLGEVHLTERSIEGALRHFPTIEDAEKNLLRFTGERTRRALQEHYELEVLDKKLGILIGERAALRGLSLEDARNEFWREIAVEADVDIMSSDYQLPPYLRGLK